MRTVIHGMLALVVIGAVAAPSARAQGVAIIEGHVTDDARRPLADVTVSIPGTAVLVRTNAQGYYTIRNVPAGIIVMRAQATGHKPFELTGLRVNDGQTIEQDFMLTLMSQPQQRPFDGEVLLHFQLLSPSATATTDRGVMALDSVLKGLFQWKGYRLLTQAAITADLPGRSPTETSQQVNIAGNMYRLSVTIDSVSTSKVRMRVLLTGWVKNPMTGVSTIRSAQGASLVTLLSTTVTVSFGHTVIIGSTQTGMPASPGSGNGTLILVVKPEIKSQ